MGENLSLPQDMTQYSADRILICQMEARLRFLPEKTAVGSGPGNLPNNEFSGNGAWSIGSVRASGTEGSEFEPSFRHPFLCGGLWQDLVIPCVWDTTVVARR